MTEKRMPGCGKSGEVKARGSGRIPYGQVSASGREFGKGKRVVELADDELEPGLVEVSRCYILEWVMFALSISIVEHPRPCGGTCMVCQRQVASVRLFGSGGLDGLA